MTRFLSPQEIMPRTATITLLLVLLAACAPADPLAFAPATATPPPAATLAPEPSSEPTPAPTPRPQPQLILPEGRVFTPAEQGALAARLADPPAEWGLTPELGVQADRSNGYIYLIPISRETVEPLGRIIILKRVDAPAWVIAGRVVGAGPAAQSESRQPQLIGPQHDDFTRLWAV